MPLGETKYVTYAGEITFGRTEDRLKERCPIVRRQIGVRNGDWNRCSAMGRRTCLDVRDRILYWQERILTLGRAEIGNPKLIANLPEVDAIDCFNEERQAIRVRLPLFVGMFIIEAYRSRDRACALRHASLISLESIDSCCLTNLLKRQQTAVESAPQAGQTFEKSACAPGGSPAVSCRHGRS